MISAALLRELQASSYRSEWAWQRILENKTLCKQVLDQISEETIDQIDDVGVLWKLIDCVSKRSLHKKHPKSSIIKVLCLHRLKEIAGKEIGWVKRIALFRALIQIFVLCVRFSLFPQAIVLFITNSDIRSFEFPADQIVILCLIFLLTLLSSRYIGMMRERLTSPYKDFYFLNRHFKAQIGLVILLILLSPFLLFFIMEIGPIYAVILSLLTIWIAYQIDFYSEKESTLKTVLTFGFGLVSLLFCGVKYLLMGLLGPVFNAVLGLLLLYLLFKWNSKMWLLVECGQASVKKISNFLHEVYLAMLFLTIILALAGLCHMEFLYANLPIYIIEWIVFLALTISLFLKVKVVRSQVLSTFSTLTDFQKGNRILYQLLLEKENSKYMSEKLRGAYLLLRLSFLIGSGLTGILSDKVILRYYPELVSRLESLGCHQLIQILEWGREQYTFDWHKFEEEVSGKVLSDHKMIIQGLSVREDMINIWQRKSQILTQMSPMLHWKTYHYFEENPILFQEAIGFY